MAVRRMLGYVPQQLSIESALTGRENVAWFARLFDVPRRERRERVADALGVMGLGDAADRLAGTYSGGMVRRLELAQALVNRPALLVLDEPTIGLDPIARDGVWRRVEELRVQTGMTVLLTTHYMEEADALCDRVALMHLGTIRAEGSPDELKAAIGADATLEDVFRHHTGSALGGADDGKGGLREIRTTRRTAARVR
jgi:ABC-2 type transport system ATP-binding protein